MKPNASLLDEVRQLIDAIVPHRATLSPRSQVFLDDMIARSTKAEASLLIGSKQLAWLQNIASAIVRCEEEAAHED